ncbi:MAG TPA: hypothetical protein VNQ32_14330, partial [Steroidobacteraceae bacterium]|nr:hypothetical protein [Steroidobacteraceae bacterium]
MAHIMPLILRQPCPSIMARHCRIIAAWHSGIDWEERKHSAYCSCIRAMSWRIAPSCGGLIAVRCVE